MQLPDVEQERSVPWCEKFWAAAGIDQQACAGCVAREQGRRCWEVEVSQVLQAPAQPMPKL
jgi:hypothetical protein